MEDTPGIVLPVLLAAIIVNTVILMLVVFVTRVGRRDRLSSTRSALDGSMLSTSYVDRSERSPWPSNGGPDPDAVRDGMAAAADDDSSDEEGSVDEEGVGAASPYLVGALPRNAAPGGADDTEQGGDTDVDPAAIDTDDATDVEAATDDEATTDDEAASGVDVLTGLLDQAAFNRLIAAEGLRLERYHRPATVVIFELGGLDRLVDRLGSDAADRVVPALADTMRRLARDVDLVARLAPGRFGVLLPETDEVAAINYVERVRRACELWLESGAIALSLAAGWAGSTGDPTLVEVLRLATDRMYLELRRDARKAADR